MARENVNKMWRKKKKKRRTKDLKQICVPKCCQQRRSAGPKPRTDFSLFFYSSSSSHSSSSSYCPSFCSILRRRRGSRLEFSSCKDNLSSIAAASMDKGCESYISIHKEVTKFPLIQSSTSQNGGKGEPFSNSTRVPFAEIDFDQTTVLDANSDRNNEGCKSGDNLNKSTSRVTGSNDLWMAPGITVWGKTASQMWWPAKIMQPIPASTYDDNVSRHILVQYYGNQERAWLDPARDVSQFDECFEVRSCNPMEAFQDALREALDSKERLRSCKQLDGETTVQKLHEQSSDAQSDKWIESSSSRTKDEFIERGRGKRKRKPKVHFDEVSFPVKSAKKMRRLRIMRYLGLTAPVGSPFSLTSLNRNCQ